MNKRKEYSLMRIMVRRLQGNTILISISYHIDPVLIAHYIGPLDNLMGIEHKMKLS